jgi:hypothetical protein
MNDEVAKFFLIFNIINAKFFERVSCAQMNLKRLSRSGSSKSDIQRKNEFQSYLDNKFAKFSMIWPSSLGKHLYMKNK